MKKAGRKTIQSNRRIDGRDMTERLRIRWGIHEMPERMSKDQRRLVHMLQVFDMAGRIPLAHPTSHEHRRLAALPRLLADKSTGRPISGRVVFDSWSSQTTLSLRDISVGFVRRIVLAAGGVSLEIVAERQQDKWVLAARVYKRKKVTSEFILQAANNKLLPSSQGFYQWTTTRTPHTFKLLSPELCVNFEKVSWR